MYFLKLFGRSRWAPVPISNREAIRILFDKLFGRSLKVGLSAVSFFAAGATQKKDAAPIPNADAVHN